MSRDGVEFQQASKASKMWRIQDVQDSRCTGFKMHLIQDVQYEHPYPWKIKPYCVLRQNNLTAPIQHIIILEPVFYLEGEACLQPFKELISHLPPSLLYREWQHELKRKKWLKMHKTPFGNKNDAHRVSLWRRVCFNLFWFSFKENKDYFPVHYFPTITNEISNIISDQMKWFVFH